MAKQSTPTNLEGLNEVTDRAKNVMAVESSTVGMSAGLTELGRRLQSFSPTAGRPTKTGRKIVIFNRDVKLAAIHSYCKSAGIRLASTADSKRGVLSTADLNDAQGVLFQHLNIAVVSKAASFSQLAAVSTGGLTAVIDERIVYAAPSWYQTFKASVASPEWSADYSAGFRDGVISTIDRAGAKVSRGRTVTSRVADVDQTQATWGLQATNVVNSAYAGKGIKIAVLDTGLDLTHPDFSGRLDADHVHCFVPGVDSVQDGHGHGTHTAGTCCGPRVPSSGPRYGVAADADLYVAKVLNDAGSGYDLWFLSALDWAITNQCRVASMSIGGTPDPQEDAKFDLLLSRAMAKGLLVIVAAGNESQRPEFISPVDHPASCEHAIAVAAIDANLDIAWFSNGGVGSIPGGQVDIAGPGVDVISSWVMPDGYKPDTGTSMATPHVSGIAALYAEADPTLTAAGLWTRLTQTARRLPASSLDVGVGLVQAP